LLTSHFISYRQSQIHYYRFGPGPSYICCFHGYGEDGSKFGLFERELGASYTLISIDLPFHGKTVWNEGLLLKPAELLEIINSIIPKEKHIALMGYSMGGRVCLQLLASFPHRFHQLVLMAPDGLHKNPWQKLATQTWIGNRLFAFSMRYPGWMFVLMRLTGSLGLFNKSIIRFVHHYLDHEQERKILYQRWTTMRLFRPSFAGLKKIISDHKIPVLLIFGKYDRVILASHGYRLQKGIDRWVSVTELTAGHHLLQEKYKNDLLKAAQL
jgi:pimeloyl-ACP methyl ester carboxylesterase